MARVKDLWKDPKRKGKGKRWLAVWQLGDGRESSRAFAKKDTAEKYGAAQETDIARGVYVSPKDSRVTAGQWCDTWLNGYRTRRPSTVAQARVYIKQIKKEFASKPLTSLRPSDIHAWTARLKVENYSDGYINALHGKLAQILNAAIADGLLNHSPCSRKTSPPMGKQRPFVITTEQLWQLHAAMPPYLQVSVLLGALAGLRTAEACGLRPEDVDVMLGIVMPRVQYPAEPLKSEMSMTDVPVPHSLSTELLAHMAQFPGDWVLVNEDDGQVGPWRIKRAVAAARKKVPGLPPAFHFHDLRHYLASYLIAHGADVKLVQARLRHAQASTTLDIYGHLWPDRDESTRTALEAVFEARPEQGRNRETERTESSRSDP